MESDKVKQVRLWLGLIFTLFLASNAFLSTLAALGGLRTGNPIMLLSADTSPAVRLLMFVIGLAVSWGIGNIIYRLLINGEIRVGESVIIAYVFLGFLLLIFAAIAFLGIFYWFLLPLLFVILLVFSILVLWRLLGGLFTLGAIAAALLVAFVTYYLFS